MFVCACRATRGKKAESSLCLPSEFLRGFSTTFDTVVLATLLSWRVHFKLKLSTLLG